MLRRRPLLPGPHGHSSGEAAHPGRPGNLVVRGPDPAYYRRADAQRLQQLVHLLLRTAEHATEVQPHLCLIFISLNLKNWTEVESSFKGDESVGNFLKISSIANDNLC
ncbi:hypothetical protein CHARACLAT_030231 [Characodon lateralis]|uniref:Uncharacterized protein n=1 Tax=Characodon lateralis TaxID=208331 RepID=A0ABU7DX60_9TELE|nr:hypothetical protein [Characodon lateralis]